MEQRVFQPIIAQVVAFNLVLAAHDAVEINNAWLLEVQADLLRAYIFSTGQFLAMPTLINAPASDPRFGERRQGSY